MAGATFENAYGTEVVSSYTTYVQKCHPYIPGQFYKRELPCIQALLAIVREPVGIIIVDGHCWLDPGHAGLGQHVYKHTGIPTIGIAKAQYKDGVAVPVLRGCSARPLWLSSSGCSVPNNFLQNMAGEGRIPTLLKLVDRLARKHA